MKALIVINFKNYKEAQGQKGIELAKKINKAKRNGYELVIAPTFANISLIKEKTELTIFSQHADAISNGAFTGQISIDELKSIGVKGTILNHSEHKLPFAKLKQIIEYSKAKKFKNIVCASTLSEIKKIAPLEPSYIAYEPKELIGSEISVTSENPDIILKAIDLVKLLTKKTKLLCGAGIHSKEDVGQALVLGTSGVLIGHAVPKAKDPKKFLEEMLL
jgi:triosephosphate isomerase (TIM)